MGEQFPPEPPHNPYDLGKEDDLPLPEVHERQDEFVETLRHLRDQLQLDEDVSVVYPGSATHAGVALVFGREHVTHVDPSERSMDAMAQAGYTTATSTIEDHRPAAPYDVMVALNSYGSPTQDVLDRLVAPSGTIIANNYTNWAQEIAASTDVELVGAVLPSYFQPEEYRQGADLDESVTDLATNYWHVQPGGGLAPAEGPGEDVFKDESARFPDGLFVFRRPSSS